MLAISPKCVVAADLKITWTTHPLELAEEVLRPEYLYNGLIFSNFSNSVQSEF